MQSMMRILVAVAAISGQRQLMLEGLRLRWLMQQGATEDSVGLDINEVSAYIGQFVAGLQGSGAGGLSDQHIALLFEQVHLRIMSGESLLHMAASHGQYEISELLIDLGAVIDDTDHFDNTPLHAVINAEDADLAELVLIYGANANARNIYNITPLQRAAYVSSPAIIRMLIDAGAEVNAVDNFGYTALIYAVMKNDLACVWCLLEEGAILTQDGAMLLYNHGYLNQCSRSLWNMLIYRPLSHQYYHDPAVSLSLLTLLPGYLGKSVQNKLFLLAAQQSWTLKGRLARAVIYHQQGQLDDRDSPQCWSCLNLIIIPWLLRSRPSGLGTLDRLPTDISRTIVSMVFVQDIADKVMHLVNALTPVATTTSIAVPDEAPLAEADETPRREMQRRRLGG